MRLYSYFSVTCGTAITVLAVIFDLDPIILMSGAAMIGSHYMAYDGPYSTPRSAGRPKPRELTPMEKLNNEYLTTDMDSIDYVLRSDKL